MSRPALRRPSPTTVIALLALFLALDGPAAAARLIDGRTIRPGTVGSAQLRDRSVQPRDLSGAARTLLTATPPGSVTASKLAPGAVTAAALAPQAVGAASLADGAVGSAALGAAAVTASRIAAGAVGTAAIADGSLQTTDLGDIYGTVTIDFKPFRVNDCQTARVDQLPSTGSQPAQIADDLVLVGPLGAGFTDLLTVTGYPGAGNTLRIVACRVGRDPSDPDNADATIDPPPTTFQYLGLDAP